MSKTFVVIPTYNEADNLQLITAELFSQPLDDLEILIIDDASPDETGKIANQLAEKYTGRFHVIHRPRKLGIGSAYLQGFKFALKNGAMQIIQMDADFSHSPEYIPEMIRQTQLFDVVVGSRYIIGGQLDTRWSFSRRFLSWWANSIWIRLILGLKTRDATAGFKCWRSSALKSIGLDRVRSNGYVFQVEMCYIAEKIGLRIKEIPIYFEDRRIGKSKMSMKIKLEAALGVFLIRFRHYAVKPISRPLA